MRKIDKIIIHCTATPEGREVTKRDLWNWHVEERGWSNIGYHYFIDLKGNVHKCRPESIKGAHTRGQNGSSIGIAYAGGLDENFKTKDTRNADQKEALECLLYELKGKYKNAIIYGHRDYSSKDCPSFDAFNEYYYISSL